MHMKRAILISCITLSSLLVSACSTRAWYEGVQQSAKNDCLDQPPSALDDCLSRVDNQSYQDYEKARAGNKQSQ